MNRQSIFNIAFILATTLLAAACSNDELADGQPQLLPEGMYPMTFTLAQGEPVTSQTRLWEGLGGYISHWNVGDQIKVVVSEGGNNMETTCTLDVNGNVTNYDPMLYWKTNQSSKINAWHSNIDGQSTVTSYTVNLADQSSGLAYVLKADEKTAINYTDQEIPLNFRHQLAKVVVKLVNTTTINLLNAKIKMKNQYISCTINKGEVTAGNTTGDIYMHRVGYADGIYEANIVQGTVLGANAFEILINDRVVKASVTSAITPAAGKVCEITINVIPQTRKEIKPDGDGKFIINDGDWAYIKDYNGPAPIIVNGNAKLDIDNVQLTTDGSAMTINENSQLEFKVENTTNSFISTNGNGIEIKNGAGINIKGDGRDVSKLVVQASQGSPDRVGIGTPTGNVSIETIEISNIYLVVTGGRPDIYGSGAAAIGLNHLNGGRSQSCEGISIINSYIDATSYGGACIGTGTVANESNPFMGNCNLGPIIIQDSNIKGMANANKWNHCGSGIGFGYIGPRANGIIASISISNTTFDITTANSSAYKVGHGSLYAPGNTTYIIGNGSNGIDVNGTKANEGWNSDTDKN